MGKACYYRNEGEAQLLYIDLHLIHEVTSPQAFSGLRIAERKVRRPDLTFGTMDHNTPTIMKDRYNIVDETSKAQLDALKKNCEEFGIELADMFNERKWNSTYGRTRARAYSSRKNCCMWR